MLSLHDRRTVEYALGLPLEPRVRELIEAHVGSASDRELRHLTHLVVIEPGDTAADMVREIGWSPLIDPIDGIEFGSPSFLPFWDSLIDRDGVFEMILSVGNDGFAFVLLIQDAEDADPDLLALCRAYAE